MGTVDELFMKRCIELASMGLGRTAPNPLVGAVLVHKGTIAGEGFHEFFGGPHAEVNAVGQVKDPELLAASTLYVSLEPCSHYGKTPPCTDLIIRSRIPKVVIGCTDPFEKVNGRGIERLRSAGIEVKTGVLSTECAEQNRRFFTFHKKKRPYVILKWAQTADGFIFPEAKNRDRQISNYYSGVLLHKWRGEEQAIMVGYRTAVTDNPRLTVRHWQGKNPLRCVIDRENDLSPYLDLFNEDAETIVFNAKSEGENKNIRHVRIDLSDNPVREVLSHLYSTGIQSLLVEGGSSLIKAFTESGLWDEARVFTSSTVRYGKGLPCPASGGIPVSSGNIEGDNLTVYKNPIQLL
jgi:diaminohydroxyphosphoribosylaminopyrimidine deaminase / 5-amino-6-(5-phosphoribosylamino)uracil reductase